MSDTVFQGLPVWHCLPGSPAEQAGVQKGDILLFVNGRRIDSSEAYLEARGVYQDRVELTVQRGNRLLEFVLRFPKPEPESAAAEPLGQAVAGPPN